MIHCAQQHLLLRLTGAVNVKIIDTHLAMAAMGKENFLKVSDVRSKDYFSKHDS